MKNQKILFISYEYPPLGGGGGIGLQTIVENIFKKNKNIQLHILTSKYKDIPFFEKNEKIKIYRVPILGRNDRHKATMISMFSWSITSLVWSLYLGVRHRYTHINTHFFAPSGPTGFIMSKIFKIPNIIYAHGKDVFDPTDTNSTPSGNGILSKLLKLSLLIQSKYADTILCNSTDTRSRILTLTNKRFSEKLIVLPLPFLAPTNTHFRKSPISGFKCVSIGRLVPRKGFNYLIESFKYLPENITLQIIGDGPHFKKYNSLISTLSLDKQVKLTGYVENNKKFQILNNSNLYVLSSIHEGLGICLQEAMFMELPIVSTNIGGQNDLVKENYNGFLCDPRDSKSLAKLILKIYKSKSIQQTFGKNSKKIIKKYSISKVIPKYEKLFVTHD